MYFWQKLFTEVPWVAALQKLREGQKPHKLKEFSLFLGQTQQREKETVTEVSECRIARLVWPLEAQSI